MCHEELGGFTVYIFVVDGVKEYILVREGTAPPCASKHLPTQPLPSPALSDSQVVGVYTADTLGYPCPIETTLHQRLNIP